MWTILVCNNQPALPVGTGRLAAVNNLTQALPSAVRVRAKVRPQQTNAK